MVIDKKKIPYDKIDVDIKNIIKMINTLPFCATISCCQGHLTTMFKKGINNRYKYTANLFIAFEVYDELKFLKFLENLQKGFYKSVNWWMNIIKEYYFDPIPNYDVPSISWRISIDISSNSKVKLKEILKRSRRWLRHCILEFKGKYHYA